MGRRFLARAVFGLPRLVRAVACEAGPLPEPAASVRVPARNADDYLQFVEFVKSSSMETAWQDHRKPTYPMTFGETNRLLQELMGTRNLPVSLEYSKETAEIRPRCVRPSVQVG